MASNKMRERKKKDKSAGWSKVTPSAGSRGSYYKGGKGKNYKSFHQKFLRNCMIAILFVVLFINREKLKRFLRRSSSSSSSVQIILDPSHIGDWGGECTCPDGQVYYAGSNKNKCGSMACIGGTSGTCNKFKDEKWARKKVICPGFEDVHKDILQSPIRKLNNNDGDNNDGQTVISSGDDTSARIILNPSHIGDWGGECTCPDGQVYYAGSNKNKCGSMACIGGTSGTCNRFKDEKWARKKVICPGFEDVHKDVVELNSVKKQNSNDGDNNDGETNGGDQGNDNEDNDNTSNSNGDGVVPAQIILDPSHIGDWGGECTCPDGQVYYAGSNKNKCGSMACIGGTSGTCNKFEDEKWARKKVICPGFEDGQQEKNLRL